MGLFKKEPVQTGQQRTRSQRMSAMDQQANEMRFKAKSRLIGAVVLVILALIVAPLIFTTTPDENENSGTAPLVAPNSNIQNTNTGALTVSTSPGVSTTGEPSSNTVQTITANGTVVTAPLVPTSVEQGQVQGSVAADTSTMPSTTTGSVAAATREQNIVTAPPITEKPASAVAEKPVTKPAEKPKTVTKPDTRITIKEKDRTDDGAAALAILEGKPQATAKSPAPSTPGKFSLQLASYTTIDDARSHRDRLTSSGVSNAYVQSAVVNGKQTYRLRVGPFTSREAAQAAQTRLRGLGQGSGFISGN